MNKRTFKSKLKSVLVDNSFSRAVSRMRSGKLDTKMLKNVGINGKCFKKSIERKGKEYSISLLLDASGSMGMDIKGTHNRSYTVTQVIPQLAGVLEDIGVNLEIHAFNVFTFPMLDYGEKLGDKFERSFASRYGKALGAEFYTWLDGDKHIYGLNTLDDDYYKHNCAGWNFDGWAIRQASMRLMKEKGEKILIVFSDGEPTNKEWYNENDLNKHINEYSIPYEVKWAKKHGIKVLSVGIQTDTTRYYPARDSIVVNNLAELFKGVIKLISLNIKRI